MINTTYFKHFPDLSSERLTFRQQSVNDAKEIYELRSNPEVMTYMDQKTHLTLKDSEDFVNENTAMFEKQAGMFWMIVEKNTNQVIGDFAFWSIDKTNSRTEIGYTLKPKYWRNGYMYETLKTILLFGFDELKLHSIQADINPKNEGSGNLLKKIGFKKEAYFVENYFFNGNYLDTEVFSLLRRDLII